MLRMIMAASWISASRRITLIPGSQVGRFSITRSGRYSTQEEFEIKNSTLWSPVSNIATFGSFSSASSMPYSVPRTIAVIELYRTLWLRSYAPCTRRWHVLTQMLLQFLRAGEEATQQATDAVLLALSVLPHSIRAKMLPKRPPAFPPPLPVLSKREGPVPSGATIPR